MRSISYQRILALLRKEFIQVRRDPVTLRFVIAVPIMLLVVYGYAINANPKHLPTGLLAKDHSKYERTILTALKNTGYYDVRTLTSEAEAERGLARGELSFVIDIPANFDRLVDRGESPSILIDADATDPSAVGNAVAALAAVTVALNRDLPPFRQAVPSVPSFRFIAHARYNSEQLTVLNIVPGLICLTLMMSTLFMTTLSISRERERGTMENLLAMPLRPIEVMISKMVPYVFIGYVQVLLILAFSVLFFQLPVRGSIPLLLLALGLFMSSNLALGIAFSTVATTQLQATQFAQLVIMPSIMLSGFMFPFLGMPVWAQWIGELLPTTHAVRIVRGLLLKGTGLSETLPELWPMVIFTLGAVAIAVWSYRETLE